VKRREYISKTQAEMAQLETAIDNYKAAYNFYPPDNTNNPAINQLYYELVGTTNTLNSPLTFQTLDGSQIITSSQLNTVFGSGVGGFVNCTKSGAGEDSPAAKRFISDLKPNQTGTNAIGPDMVTLLAGSVGGPDQNYTPLAGSGLNPWRYNSSNPVNNPGAYDLYIQLVISGRTNLICNWSKQVQINSSLP